MDINKVEVEKRRTFLDLSILLIMVLRRTPEKLPLGMLWGGNSLDVEDLRVYPIQSELSNVIKLRII
jgi:hypothetical protein